jgi:hypothetical protein
MVLSKTGKEIIKNFTCFSNKMDSKKLMLPKGQVTIFLYILKFVKYQTKTSG